jgi:hypothetical protein
MEFFTLLTLRIELFLQFTIADESQALLNNPRIKEAYLGG